MVKNSSKILFITILMVGTMISISSNSWLGAWMGLEINLLSFIPLMTNTSNLMSSEAALKYFLVQALASSILLFAVILTFMKMNIFQSNTNMLMNFPNTIIMSSLILKSGAAPFHFWFPSVMEGLSWINALLLMTWQKIAPLMLISYLIIKPLLYLSIGLSIIVGSLGGLNQTSLRKLMAFSSINHLGWLLAAMTSGENLWMGYFMIYTILSMNLITLFNSFKFLHINQLFSSFFSSKTLKFTTMINLLSLGGLPPFLGFFPKWLVIQSMTLDNQLLLMVFMTTFTLVTLLFYIRICYSAFLLNYSEPNWNSSIYFNNLTMFSYLILSFMSNSMLFLISLVYFFI